MNIERDDTISKDEQNQLIDRIARQIVKFGLEAPAVLFLDMNKPLAFAAGQAMLVGLPLFGPLLGSDGAHKLLALAQDPSNLEKLIQAIERAGTPVVTDSPTSVISP